MDKLQKELVILMAKEHNISAKTLADILKDANDFSYMNATKGERLNKYHGLIKFAASKEIK